MELMTNKLLKEAAIELHRKHRGKMEIKSRVDVNNDYDMSLAYSPGVAEPCKLIAVNKNAVYEYTNKGNLIAVISNGTAVLGLGNIGPEAGLPVMEGKAILFKAFGKVDAIPICIHATGIEEVVNTIKQLEPTFGGINLEDIASPECFEIEERLNKIMNIPVFHDDQHGTAVVTVAGLINSLKLVGKSLEQICVVTSGAGAAGVAIVKALLALGVEQVIMTDREGAIYRNRQTGMNAIKEQLSHLTNPDCVKGTLEEVIRGADVFIGISSANLLTEDMIRSMNIDPIVFAMANPDPEIDPYVAKQAGARVVGTGRSDYPNQVNNVLAFPGIFRGALDVRASEINSQMMVAAAYAIAGIIKDEELTDEYVVPKSYDRRVVPAVAIAVAQAAIETGVARIHIEMDEILNKFS